MAGAAAATPIARLRYDVRIVRARRRCGSRTTWRGIVASADLQLRGTFDRPLLFGRADVERGEVTFEGRRYLITRGTIDFNNPSAIEPFFDIEAETRVRVPGQTYRVTLRVAGTLDRLQPEFTSDPPLPRGRRALAAVRRHRAGGDVEFAAAAVADTSASSSCCRRARPAR